MVQDETFYRGGEVRWLDAVTNIDFDVGNNDVGTAVHDLLYLLQIVFATHRLVMVHEDDILARGHRQSVVPVPDGTQTGLVMAVAQAAIIETGYVVGNV